ncbi:hypothetical protein [Capnocytophaga gingivalis]|nr:hypothetical protein [Capnocytophaga gingivalis]
MREYRVTDQTRCVHTWGDKDLYNRRLNFLEGKTIKRWARV